MDEKVMIIVNPSSGSEQALEASGELVKILAADYPQMTVLYTQEAGDAKAFAERACLEDYHAVFGLGGDGTIYEIMNGLALYENPPTLGVIPMGTINNFARMLGIPMNMNDALQSLKNRQIIHADIGQINDQYFISTVSTGALPESARNVDAEEKTRLGSLAYLFEGVKALDEDNLSCFHIELDQDDLDDEFSLVVIGLGNSVAGFPNFFKSSSITDGKLHFLGLKDSTFLEKMSVVPEIFQEEAYTSPYVVTKDFDEAKIYLDSGESLGTTVDGEEGPDFPLTIRVLKGQQPVFVPAGN